MKRSIILLSLVSLIMLSVLPLILAEQTNAPTQQFNKIYLNPFYRETLASATNYSYNVTVNPPDGVSSVANAIISFNGQINGQTQNFTLWVNGKSCNNPSYVVATAFSTTGNVQMYFDCSNIITRAGTYNITLRSAVNTGTMQGWLDLTYMNNPKGGMTIHGTEYTYDQIGKVWLQLLDANGNNVNDGVCYADIYTPSGGYLIEGATMTNMAHDGIYYYDLTIPILQGVYPAIAKCYYQAGQNKRVASSFVLTSGSVSAGTYLSTQVLDTVYHTIGTNKNGGLTVNNRVNVTYNFSDFNANCGNVSELLTTGLTIYWNGIWNTGTTNHDVSIYVYNYTSNLWITFGNKILGGQGGATQTITNSISTTNFTKALGINSTNQMRIKLADNDINEGSKDLKNDYIYASCDQLTNATWQEVKGSSELHVISDLDYVLSIEDDVFTINDTQVVTLANGSVITDSYYTGIFNNQFELASGVAITTDVVVEYQGLHSIPCNAIISLFIINDTGYYPYPFTTQRQTEENHCSVNFNLTLKPLEVYNFEVHAKNVWESDLRSTNTAMGAIYPLIDAGCQLWRISKGFPQYIIPKNQTNTAYDYYYRACGNWYDNYYWFNQSYLTSFTNKDLIVDENTYVQYESDYTSSKFIGDELNLITSLIIQNLLSVGQYSKILIENPLGNLTNTTDQKYWAQQSTIYQNWLILNASCGTGLCRVNGTDVWNYTGGGRNLTYYPTINASVINLSTDSYNNISAYVWNQTNRSLVYTDNFASAVWSYNGTIVPNIIQTLVNNTWAYTGILSNALTNQIGNSVWSFNGNSSTFMVQTVVNSSWGYSARYVHGTILS